MRDITLTAEDGTTTVVTAEAGRLIVRQGDTTSSIALRAAPDLLGLGTASAAAGATFITLDTAPAPEAVRTGDTLILNAIFYRVLAVDGASIAIHPPLAEEFTTTTVIRQRGR